jgi:hypothetical protein
MEEQRKLCAADNNTCPNLATLKFYRKNGKPVYRNICDGHRRKGHRRAIDPTSVRYVPLDACVMCIAPAKERHRIVSGSSYDKEGIVGLCANCHRKLHKFYEVIKERGYTIV